MESLQGFELTLGCCYQLADNRSKIHNFTYLYFIGSQTAATLLFNFCRNARKFVGYLEETLKFKNRLDLREAESSELKSKQLKTIIRGKAHLGVLAYNLKYNQIETSL